MLLLGVLAAWRLPLIDEVEQMRLVLVLVTTNSTGSSNAVVANAGCGCAEGAAASIPLNLVLVHHVHVELVLVMVVEVVDWGVVTGVTLPQFSHKIAIKHGLSHLLLVLLVVGHRTRSAIIAFDTEAADSGLIKHMLIVLAKVRMMPLVVDVG